MQTTLVMQSGRFAHSRIGLIDDGGRLQGVPRALVTQVVTGDALQLLINLRRDFGEHRFVAMRIALGQRGEPDGVGGGSVRCGHAQKGAIDSRLVDRRSLATNGDGVKPE